MIEVSLAKRLLTLALGVLVTMGAAACTREKPSEPTAPPIAQYVTPIPLQTTTPATGGITPSVPITSTVTTAIASAAESPTPVLVTSATATATPTQTIPSIVSSPTTTPSTYTVQWGDWLNKIAQQFGISPQAIIAANPGMNPNVIYPGQVLKIPSPGAPSPTPPAGGITPPSPTGPSTYTVQRGDWFYAIARKFGVSVAALQAANPGVNPNLVYPGQVLNIPGNAPSGPTPPASTPTTTYTVQRGDTLFSIAVRFRTTVYALQIANHLASPNFIYPGQVLIIPQ